jgi:2-hydroxy-3-oxopropionate reductase
MSDAKALHKPLAQHPTVGVIGIGRMGLPIVKTLKRAGFDVVATSRSQASRASAAAEDIKVVDTPCGVAEKATLILISVFDTAALEEVIQGEDGLIDSLQAGSIVIDLGTSAISETLKLATLIEDAGAFYIDAPVSGGTRGAAEGKLTIMAGGEHSAIDAARPVFEALGRLNHMGRNGAGQNTKAINQLVLGQNLIAVAEGMTLAKQLGLDPRQVREALIGGFAESRVLIEHG